MRRLQDYWKSHEFIPRVSSHSKLILSLITKPLFPSNNNNNNNNTKSLFPNNGARSKKGVRHK